MFLENPSYFKISKIVYVCDGALFYGLNNSTFTANNKIVLGSLRATNYCQRARVI